MYGARIDSFKRMLGATANACSRCCVGQRGTIPDEPHMAKRVLESALAMRPPRHGVHGELVAVRGCARGQGAPDEGIRVFAEHLYPN